VVEVADLKDGEWRHPYGEHPRGYLVYDATGRMHVQIMKTPPLAPFAEADFIHSKLPSPENSLAAYSAYVAYFGTYTVDAKKSVVTHHVEGALMPEFTGTEQPRPFKLTGDRLEIGDGKTWRRVFERVK
jgi:hypothetical protein